ncbi:hypothetical protein M011DRAFT_468852 [Sporormia fimetaria CBS 119925]|uniref:Uncharacterized protein n=1 Tax=Sporormia fimetaria CBS 119925 TaxID=1340428 RepID=A0A6A6VA26_9PLEO|nr:hypothetical protein M011DRAFT_468852 [Sporormia fimetaria CBS 119925]
MAMFSPTTTFLSLPQELRDKIFEAAGVAAFPGGPKTVIQHWFEVQDVKAQVSLIKQQTPDIQFKAKYSAYEVVNNSYNSADDPDDNGGDGEEVDLFPRAESESDDSEDDEFGEDDDGEAEDADDADEDEMDALEMEEDEMDEDEEDEDEEDEDEDEDDEDEDDEDEDHDQDMSGGTLTEDATDMEATNMDMDEAVTVPENIPEEFNGTVINPHQKWRHIPKFLTLSHVPLPVELMLTSKDMKQQAEDAFYGVATLRIQPTASFAHTSMFETAVDQLLDYHLNHPASPFQKIRNAEVMFAWDTEWLRSSACQGNEDFFNSLLTVRAGLACDALRFSPLQKITVHWYDSVNDENSGLVRDSVFAMFGMWPFAEFKQHYLAPGAKPRRKTPVGNMRLDFQDIAARGFRLY